MRKAVLISIKPEWCELIASGKKTVEVRKSRPKLDTPFKVYIYCTKSPKGWFFMNSPDVRRDGKVIGEFVCNEIERVGIPYPAYQSELDKRYIEQSCVSYYALHRYFGRDDGYFWHISDLKIYDKPKELTEFKGLRTTKFGYEPVEIKRAPQSWCYVEESEENA